LARAVPYEAEKIATSSLASRINVDSEDEMDQTGSLDEFQPAQRLV
jgi:hypothetical protein